MDLHEEYWSRRGVKAPLVKHVERANLILKSKGDSEWAWLHASIVASGDNTHPQKYSFTVSANPTMYSTSDYNHISPHSKVLKEHTWEWDQYEPGLIAWAREHACRYVAIPSGDAVLVAWEMFCGNFDHWMANFLPLRIQEQVYVTLLDDRTVKTRAIKEVEDFIREKYERVFLCWKNIKGAIEQKNYADWLVKVVNDMANEN